MEFALGADQKMMQESVNRTLDRICPLDRVRTAAESNEPAQDVWKALVELGIPGLLIPEQFGGVGLKLLDAALVSEALGRHAAPVPFVASCVMAPIALLRSGNSVQQSNWLPKLASGEAIAAVAISEQISGARDDAGVTSQGGKLNGKALFVIDFAVADIAIVADRECGLHLVDMSAPGVKQSKLTTIDLTAASVN